MFCVQTHNVCTQQIDDVPTHPANSVSPGAPNTFNTLVETEQSFEPLSAHAKEIFLALNDPNLEISSVTLFSVVQYKGVMCGCSYNYTGMWYSKPEYVVMGGYAQGANKEENTRQKY